MDRTSVDRPPARWDLPCPRNHPPPDSRRPAGAGSSRPATPTRPRPARRWRTLPRLLVSPLCLRPRKGHDPETAQDLVQGLFAGLLEREDLRGLEPERGRFRSFLMACCSHYLARHHDRERAVKRGGGRALIPIDTLMAESRFGGEPSHDLTRRASLRTAVGPDPARPRPGRPRWGDGAGRTSGRSTSGSGRLSWATREPLSYQVIADELGLTEGAVKMAAHRLRARYRERLREEIARTVADPSEIDAEIRPCSLPWAG